MAIYDASGGTVRTDCAVASPLQSGSARASRIFVADLFPCPGPGLHSVAAVPEPRLKGALTANGSRGVNEPSNRIYEGKAKILYEGLNPVRWSKYFQGRRHAFNAAKKATLDGKGVLNITGFPNSSCTFDGDGIPTQLPSSPAYA